MERALSLVTRRIWPKGDGLTPAQIEECITGMPDTVSLRAEVLSIERALTEHAAEAVTAEREEIARVLGEAAGAFRQQAAAMLNQEDGQAADFRAEAMGLDHAVLIVRARNPKAGG